MGSIIGQKIDYNGVGALGGQQHIPSKLNINPSIPLATANPQISPLERNEGHIYYFCVGSGGLGHKLYYSHT